MKNIRCCNFLVIIYMLYCVGVKAQQIVHLDNQDGLLNGIITVFEKDSLGYLWIGSNKGLIRYSGEEFKNYDLKTITSSAGTGIIGIMNIQGILYMISPNGYLLKYDYQYDRFKEVLRVEGKRFLAMAPLDDKRILIGLDHGLFMFNTKTKQTSEIQYSETFINRQILVSKNQVYVATGRGCYIYGVNKDSEVLSLKEILLEENDIINIAVDSNERLFIGTETAGLFIKDNKEIKPIHIKELDKKTYAIRKIKFDNQNNVLVAIDRLGLFVLDENLNVNKTFSHDLDDQYSISQNSIYDIYVDDSNAYWLGLREGGIDIIHGKDNVFNHIKHVLNESNSIYDNTIRAIYETENGDLWFGTENGMSKYSGDEFTNYNQNQKLYNTAVLSISEYKNKLLLGTYGEGILAYDKVKNEVVKSSLVPAVTSKLIFNISIFDDNLWVAVGNDGPLLHYLNDKYVANYDVGLVRYLVQGYEDINYAGSTNGFYEINKRNKSIRKLHENIFNNLNEIHSLNFDHLNNTIWIGCTNGFYKFNLSDETLVDLSIHVNKELGTVFSVKKDNRQYLYLACTSGLWRYDIRNKLFRKYDVQDGLYINEFGTGASAVLNDGQLAFGGPEGAVIFQPMDLENDHQLKNIHVSNFQINGKSPDSLTLGKNVNYVQDIVLNFDQNSIAFNFGTIKFHGSKRNRYEYRLSGYDDSIRNAYGNEKITYSNLKPGKYKLLATGFNADGEKSANDYELNIKVKKPFWKTNVAILSYILIFCFFVYLVYKVTKANIRKRFDENRIKFFIEVAHDIRTPVALIQLLVKQLSNQENVEKSLELIHRNTQNLNEYVTQLLDFQKIDRNQLKLSVRKVDLMDCLNEVINDFTPIVQEKSLDIVLEAKHIPVWFDAEKMKRIFYNLISNAIKYSDEGGEIKINAYINNDTLHVEFIDYGIGIPEKQQDIVFKRFTRGTNVSNKGIPGTGIGLMLSKKIVELHGGKIVLESKENFGSKFTIVLPNGTQHYRKEDLIQETLDIDKSKVANDLIHKSKLVLLVEDNKELREAVKRELDEYYTIVEASNGKEGLLIALSKTPDLIITDIMMPEMDGKELCELLKTNFKTRHIPIIMLTALEGIDDKIQGLKIGADAYVEKPFNVEILKATINNLIKSREDVSHLLDVNKTEKPLTPDESFLSDLITIIKEHLTDKDFSIDTLCEMIGLSRSNLFRKLKGLIEMSPSDLIIKIKLSRAEDLMKNKAFTRISDIAYESGFQDPKYFSTLFKKHYGKTPKEFADEI